MLELLSIGDLVQDGTYRVHSRFRRAVNFTDGWRLVTVLGRGMDAGPMNVVVKGFDSARAEALQVERGAVTLDGVRLPFDDRRVYLSGIRLDHSDRRRVRGGTGHFGALLVQLSPEKSLAFLLDYERLWSLDEGFERNLGRHMSHCVKDVLYWNRIRGVERLKGCGIGLTPAGDDFIAGFLLGLNVLGLLGVGDWSETRRGVLETALSGNTLTDTFLYLAEEGRVFESMKLLIAALAKGAAADIRSSTERLLAIGATSGADLAVGFYLTLREGMAGRLSGSPRTANVGWTMNEGEGLWS
jgi:uncharacterized membrane protein (Fun14 family)